MAMSLESDIEKYIDSLSDTPTYDEISKTIDKILVGLSETGKVKFGDDKQLGGTSLEIRVRLILNEIGFDVKKGRPGMEDLVVAAPSGATITAPLAIEVKSGNKENISRADLRQLDDWTFDLSDESNVRKHGISIPATNLSTLNILPTDTIKVQILNPSLHKGVLLYNGPIGKEFSSRPVQCYSQNEQQFIDERNFCIISLGVLLEYLWQFQSGSVSKDDLWHKIQTTTGMLESP